MTFKPKGAILQAKVRPLKNLHFLLLWLFRSSYSRPKLTVFLFLATWIALLPFATNLRVLLSTTEMLPAQSEASQRQRQVDESFTSGDPLTVLITKPGRKFNTSELCLIKDWVKWLIRSKKQVNRVQSIFHLRNAVKDEAYLNFPFRLDLDCTADPQAKTHTFAPHGPYANILYSKSSDSLYIDMTITKLKQPDFFGSFNYHQLTVIDDSIKKLKASLADTKIHLQGPAGVRWHFMMSLLHDQLLNIGISIILLILFRLLYGTFIGGFLLLTSIGLTVGILSSLMNYFQVPFDILTNSLFIIICLAAAEDFLYLSESNLLAKNARSYRRHFSKFLLPSLFTSLTTIVGFGSLAVSEIEPISRLGLWAAIGALIEWAVTFFYLPAVISLVPKLGLWTNPHKTSLRPLTRKISQLKYPRWLVRTSILGMVFLSLNIPNIKNSDSIGEIWSQDHAFNKGIKATTKAFNWSGSLELIFKDTASDPDNNNILAEISKLPHIQQIESSDTLTSEFVGGLHDPTYRSIALRELGRSHSMQRYRSTGDPLERAFLYTDSIDSAIINTLRRHIDSICGGICYLSGELINHSIFSQNVIETLINSFVFSLILVSLTLVALCFITKEREIFAVVFSSIWGPVFLLGILSYALPGINFVTSIFAAVLVGLAGDNSIQYLFASNKDGISQGVDRRKEGTVNIALILTLASLIFLFSDFKQPKVLGLLFSVGYIILLVGDLWILKGLVKKKADPPPKMG